MRRLILSLAILGGPAIVGCNHTAGVCDCDPHQNPAAAPTLVAPAPRPEVIKDVPIPDAK